MYNNHDPKKLRDKHKEGLVVGVRNRDWDRGVSESGGVVAIEIEWEDEREQKVKVAHGRYYVSTRNSRCPRCQK